MLRGSIAIVAAISSELIGRTLFIQTGIGLRIPGRFNQPYDVEGPSDHRPHRGSGDYLHAGDHLESVGSSNLLGSGQEPDAQFRPLHVGSIRPKNSA